MSRTLMRYCQACCQAIILFSLCCPLACQAVASGTVVTSIRPLQWFVQALLPPGIEVKTLLPTGQSAHDYTLRPSDMVSIQQASLLVWIGAGMEPWLVQVAGRLPTGVSLPLLLRGPGQASGPLAQDPHLWLDPVGMMAVTGTLSGALQQQFPEQAAAIEAREQILFQALQGLDAWASATLTPVRAVPFVVYHDSYSRLVTRYQLTQQAAVWRHESLPSGVRERGALLDVLRQGQVRCIFHEPEYGQEAVQGWLSPAATGIAVQALDPLGDRVTGSGIEAYTRFFQTLVQDLSGCLAGRQAGG